MRICEKQRDPSCCRCCAIGTASKGYSHASSSASRGHRRTHTAALEFIHILRTGASRRSRRGGDQEGGWWSVLQRLPS